MKEIQRHSIVPGEQSSVYGILNLPAFNIHKLLYSHTKMENKAKDCFNITQRTTKKKLLVSIPET